jgi:hypothetical protein
MLWFASLVDRAGHRFESIEPFSKPSQNEKLLPGQSVAATTQVPLPEHVLPAPQETGAPHWPHESHVCTPFPEHCVLPGLHTGVDPHEHVPQAQLALQYWLPYVLQVCVALGAHAP